MADPDTGSGDAWKQVRTSQVSWGNIDTRYAKKRIPKMRVSNSLKIEGWKGERVHAQAVVWTPSEIGQLQYVIGDFYNRKGKKLSADTFKAGFVRYVMTDGLNVDGKGACGNRPDHSVYDSILVADPIDGLIDHIQVEKNNTQCIWFSCDLPREIDAGIYKGVISIMHQPWNGQTEDYFESMVTWTKMLDGSWRFDYDIFDAWVEFMMDLGIDRQINCYTMIPWKLSYKYFDQRTNSIQFIHTCPGEKEFEEMWVAMLSSFSSHLKEKGWFDKATIAMDERPMEAMLKTIHVIMKADSQFKISLAGNWHEELDEYIYDYSIPIGAFYPKDALIRRHMTGKHSTYYTCCTEPYPNGFTFSPAAENEWIGFYCAKESVSGYLKWAFNSWPLEPLLDSRFRSWAGGDTYIIYPGPRSSIRYERMRDGFENFEKISILRAEFEKEGDSRALSKLDETLDTFVIGEIPTRPASMIVNVANKILNNL